MSCALAQCTRGKAKANRDTRVLGNDGSKCDAVHLHAETEYEPKIEGDICKVDREKYIQGHACVLQSQEPANQNEVGECARRAPDAY